MERIGQCHCGLLRVITDGEPTRVYVCHCKSCQRRTGTAFHYGATFLKERVRLDGERRIFERGAHTGYRIRFHFCPNCGSTVYWEGDRNPRVCGVGLARLKWERFPRRAILFSRSRCTTGSTCLLTWDTTNKTGLDNLRSLSDRSRSDFSHCRASKPQEVGLRLTTKPLCEENRMPYRLHYFPESGNSYKLALMLTLCGEQWEPVWTDFGGGATRTPEWRATINEMGEIPVLEEDDVRLTQTAPILLRLAERSGRFLGADQDERFQILRWLFWDNHKLTGYMARYRYQRTFTSSPDPQVLGFFRNCLDDFLGIVEQHLQGRAFVVGDRPTVADLSMVGYLFFPKEETGYDFMESHPAIRAWLDRVAALPGWKHPYELLPGKRLRRYRKA